ncbi:MAG TPA: adenylate/guanylate cyclase domain-containing protein [Actinomycetota bacterium]|nr:adenylate/guanylate cyclase domain-containing protein [Actinomycetota bacterium]
MTEVVRPPLEDPRLRQVADQVDRARFGGMLLDSDWNLVWVSEEMIKFLFEPPYEPLLGQHVIHNYMSDAFCRLISEESQIEMMMKMAPYLIWGTPGGKEGLKKIMSEAHQHYFELGRDVPQWAKDAGINHEQTLEMLLEGLDTVEPVEPPGMWIETFEFLYKDLPPTRIAEMQMPLRDDSGDIFGYLVLYMPALPAGVLQLVARGDEGMFERMIDLVEPGRNPAAILFCDLQDSGVLSRRLPSAAYFKLVRALTDAIDECVVQHKGIVGKHAGDGVTAFFLADDLGSPSGAAHAAIEAGRRIAAGAGRVAKEVGEETGLIEAADCVVNVGLHWGGTLYMGQLVTGGRLEVTALGDTVNECARIQETARDGTILGSKQLIENLTPEDAETLNVDPDSLVYRTVAELSSATEKAKRDAGGIPVTTL